MPSSMLCLLLLLSTLSLLIRPTLGSGENFNCTDTTCDSVSCCADPSGNNCPSMDCTPSQLSVISPLQPCGCCTRCIDQQAEGDECDIDNSDSFGDLPQQICGHGLTCTPYKNTGQCRPITATECVKMQQEYDKEALTSLIPGKLRPTCNAEGLFQPAQRQPGLTTSCYSEKGERIYGERGSTEDDNMLCQCSRLYLTSEPGDEKNSWPHCSTDGSFDELQCNNITCYCVDAVNGTITSVIAAWPFKDLLPCFNSTIHRTDYLKPCELMASELEEDKKEWASHGYTLLGDEPPNCDIGGYFDKVQESRTERHCVSPDGRTLEGYQVPRSSDAAVNMTCNCARSSYLMSTSGQLTDLPQCCDNGDFRPWQCRGLYCYCVDVNGQQYGSAVPQSSLENLQCSLDDCPSTAPKTYQK